MKLAPRGEGPQFLFPQIRSNDLLHGESMVISTFMTNEKEFAALSKEIQGIREMLLKIMEVEVKNQIRFEALLAGLYEKHSISQDSLDEIKSTVQNNHDELMNLLRKYGKKRDAKD